MTTTVLILTSVKLTVQLRGAPLGQKIVAGTDLLHTRISDETKMVSQILHTRIQDETTLVSNCILGFLMKPKWFQKIAYSDSGCNHTDFTKNCILGLWMKPVWFHPESEYALFVKPFWFHQKSEYEINQCRRRFFGLMAPPWSQYFNYKKALSGQTNGCIFHKKFQRFQNVAKCYP